MRLYKSHVRSQPGKTPIGKTHSEQNEGSCVMTIMVSISDIITMLCQKNNCTLLH